MNDNSILNYYFLNRPRVEAASDSRYLFLLDYLQEYGPLSLDELVADTGFDVSLVLQIMNSMLTGDLVSEEGEDRWAVCDAGRKLLHGTIGLSNEIEERYGAVLRARRIAPASALSITQTRTATATNQELLTICLQGRAKEAEGAWREFIRRFEPVIAGTVAQIAKRHGFWSYDVIGDLTQDVYLKLCSDSFKLLRNLKLTHDNSLFAYLKLVAGSVAHDYFKSIRKWPAAGNLDKLETHAQVPDVKEGAIERELLLQEIEAVLDRITVGPHAQRDRLVFWLYYRQGLQASEIADIPTIDLKREGIEALLHRIRQKLWRALTETQIHREAKQFLRS